MQKLFVAGGNDGEMNLIKSLLNINGNFVVQPKTERGNHFYAPCDLRVQIQEAIGGTSKYYFNGVPLHELVFIECFPAEGARSQKPELRINLSIIDHHNGDSWERASIMQVLNDHCGNIKISEALRRNIELTAANDVGYIPAMEAMFATESEIAAIRRADRNAQGITPQMEAQAEEAIANKEVRGNLTIVRMPHSKCATVTDRLYGKYHELLILSGDGEVNFYGNGKLCVDLKEKFEGRNGGTGLGSINQSAYWGGYPDHAAVTTFIADTVNKK